MQVTSAVKQLPLQQ